MQRRPFITLLLSLALATPLAQAQQTLRLSTTTSTERT